MIAQWREEFNDWHYSTQLFLIFVLVNVLDFQTTGILVHLHGYGVEVNPIPRFFMTHFDSILGLLALKTVFLGSLYAAVCYAIRREWYSQDRLVLPLQILTGVFSLVVISNLINIFLS